MTTTQRALIERLAEDYAMCADRLLAKALTHAVTNRFEEVIVCQTASRTATFIARCFSEDEAA